MTGPSAVLPHRPPMLLVDGFTSVHPGLRLTAHRTVRPDDPWCHPAGLAPDLVLESWLQACSALLCWERPGSGVLLAGLRDARVLRPVHVGETVVHHVELVRGTPGAAICTGSGEVGGQVVLSVGQATIAFPDGGRQ